MSSKASKEVAQEDLIQIAQQNIQPIEIPRKLLYGLGALTVPISGFLFADGLPSNSGKIFAASLALGTGLLFDTVALMGRPATTLEMVSEMGVHAEPVIELQPAEQPGLHQVAA